MCRAIHHSVVDHTVSFLLLGRLFSSQSNQTAQCYLCDYSRRQPCAANTHYLAMVQVVVERSWGGINTGVSGDFKVMLLHMEHNLMILDLGNPLHIGAIQQLGQAVIQHGLDAYREMHDTVSGSGSV